MKIISIVGARPQFIKLAPLCLELSKRKEIEHIIVNTGQHYDYNMSKLFFDELGLPEPKYHLEIGVGNQGYQTGEIIKKSEEIYLQEKPDLVVVFGDTTSTLGGALAASKLHIPIVHVEAGLRSYDKTMPEEINRIIVDQISTLLFCPTKVTVKNLKKEGVTNGVFVVGDIMIDSLVQGIKIAETKQSILSKLNLMSQNYYLTTIHRQSNTDIKENLQNLVDTLCSIDGIVVLPLHPRTEKMLKQFNLYTKLKEKVMLIEPVGYFDMLVLEKNAKMILTDSGGIQKEAYFFKVPCVTLRDTTEWVETIEDGWNVIAGTDKTKILNAINNFEPNLSKHKNIYGSGKASKKIVEILNNILINKISV